MDSRLWLAVFLIAAIPARSGPLIQTSTLLPEDRKPFEWFDELGYATGLPRATLVRISQRIARDKEDISLGYLLSRKGDESKVLLSDGLLTFLRTDVANASGVHLDRLELRDVAEEAIAVKPDDSGLVHLPSGPVLNSMGLFLLARSCAGARLDVLAHELLAMTRVASGDPDDLRKALADDLDWRFLGNIFVDYQHGAPRAEVRERLKRFIKTYPRYENVSLARDTERTLNRMIDEDRKHTERPGKPSTQDQIREWIFALRDESGFQFSQPGSVQFLPYSPDTNPAKQLVAAGQEAVPPLIEALEDKRLTRGVYFRTTPRYVVTIGECVREILEAISGRRFRAQDSQGNFDGKATKALASAWWRDLQTKGERQVLIEGTLAGRMGQAALLVSKYPQDAAEALREALATTSETVRYDWISVLTTLRTGGEVSLLRDALNERDVMIQLMAARALVERGIANADVNAIVAIWDELVSIPGLMRIVDTDIAESVSTSGRTGEVLSPLRRWSEISASERREMIRNAERIEGPEAARAAAEALLIGALDDADPAERSWIESSTGASIDRLRLCDVAADALSRTRSARYSFDVHAPIEVRDRNMLAMKIAWRTEKGLGSLPQPDVKVCGNPQP